MPIVTADDGALERLRRTVRESAPRRVGRRHAILTLAGGLVLLASPRFANRVLAAEICDLPSIRCPETECGYVYDPAYGDPDGGIAAGTAFDDLPDDWECPDCGTPKYLW